MAVEVGSDQGLASAGFEQWIMGGLTKINVLYCACAISLQIVDVPETDINVSRMDMEPATFGIDHPRPTDRRTRPDG